MPQSKEVHKEYMRKYRQGSQNGTEVHRIEFIQKELNNPQLVKDIEGASKIFNDREARYERAYRYLNRDKHPELVHALVEDRHRLEKIHQSLKNRGLLKEVTYGVNGPDFVTVGDLLDATAHVKASTLLIPSITSNTTQAYITNNINNQQRDPKLRII